jgi:hypothetical protein
MISYVIPISKKGNESNSSQSNGNYIYEIKTELNHQYLVVRHARLFWISKDFDRVWQAAHDQNHKVLFKWSSKLKLTSSQHASLTNTLY